MDFNLTTAREFAREGRIEEWIHSYLSCGHWINLGLSHGLKKQPRYWAGPFEIDLADITRCCGPEENMEYRQDAESWKIRTADLAAGFNQPTDLPPLIVHYLPYELSIRDGSHRHEALRLKGFTRCWILLWFENEQDLLKEIENKAQIWGDPILTFP